MHYCCISYFAHPQVEMGRDIVFFVTSLRFQFNCQCIYSQANVSDALEVPEHSLMLLSSIQDSFLYRGSVVVKVLCYKLERLGFMTR
jgi:hypothetical protein